MEPIRNVVKLNGRSVSKKDNLSKSNFKSGDRVTILFQKSEFEGIVNFAREQDTIEEAQNSRTSTPVSTTRDVAAEVTWSSARQ